MNKELIRHYMQKVLDIDICNDRRVIKGCLSKQQKKDAIYRLNSIKAHLKYKELDKEEEHHISICYVIQKITEA